MGQTRGLGGWGPLQGARDGAFPAATFGSSRYGRGPYPSYVVAACLEVRGLSEERDCYELRLLRLFNDEHVSRSPGGNAELRRHRDEGEKVMRALGRLEPESVREALVGIFEQSVAPLVSLIMAGMWDEARRFQRVAYREVGYRFLGTERRGGPVG